MTRIPGTMTAIAIAAPDEPEVLTPCGIGTPWPAAGEVLVRVAAAGVNRPDCMHPGVIYRPLPLAQASEAHRLMERNEIIGKVVPLMRAV
jgi:NADPH2:quinone reductase